MERLTLLTLPGEVNKSKQMKWLNTGLSISFVADRRIRLNIPDHIQVTSCGLLEEIVVKTIGIPTYPSLILQLQSHYVPKVYFVSTAPKLYCSWILFGSLNAGGICHWIAVYSWHAIVFVSDWLVDVKPCRLQIAAIISSCCSYWD